VTDVPEPKLIWATRGRSWGFKFLRDGGEADPLPVYERAFAGIGDEPQAWRPGNELGALRFLDPQGRRDQSGRVIPHDFVIFPPLLASVRSVKDGIESVWPLVSEKFARIWDDPPAGLGDGDPR
jgi:hypothetical protein